MYYLAKFCRICVKSDVDLVDVDSDDVDSIKLSQKLMQCTKMVISKESSSTKICGQCIKKLRISYDFHNMCEKSTNILQGLVSELMKGSKQITTDNFTNSDIRVTLSPLQLSNHCQRKRITKSERCSILKSLLSNKNISKKNVLNDQLLDNIQRGGLKDIIAFTKNYNFGYVEDNGSSTPLGKLVQFSEDFFKRDFTEFQQTVLIIIENKNYLDEDEEMFETCPDETSKEMPYEEVVIEPDIRVKTELFEDQELDDNLNYCKLENGAIHNIFIKEEDVSEVTNLEYLENISPYSKNDQLFSNLDYMKQLESQREFSKGSVRCRTRGNPYINPHLKKQFMLRSFQCKKCPRYFKTPGYLKAHCVKVHNALN